MPLNITAITGSGISAPSGIRTYRDKDSGWDEYANGIAHASKYGNYLPQLWKGWTTMARQFAASEPNVAHRRLAAAKVNVITQNVDGLHSVAGSENVIELHGDMRTMRCLRCRKTMPIDLSTDSPTCQHCGSARVRVNTVLFGENLSQKKVRAAQELILNSDLVLVIGTSGVVHPARNLIDTALDAEGVHTVLFNYEPWPRDDEKRFNEVFHGNCAVTVPEYL